MPGSRIAAVEGDARSVGRLALAAASADIVLILARAGAPLPVAARRDARIAALMGVRRAALVVDHMDLVGFGQAPFLALAGEFRAFCATLGFARAEAIPVCARTGENVAEPGASMPWHQDGTLCAWLLAQAAQACGGGAAAVGDALVARGDPAQRADQFEARLLWTGEHPMIPGRQYRLRLNAAESTATITAIKYHEDPETGARLAARTLARDEIAVVNVSTARPVVFDRVDDNPALGRFVLLEKDGADPVGTGVIDFGLRRAANIHWQSVDLDKAARSALKGQRPRCIWFTGLSGSGKSTLANLLERRLHAEGRHTYLLDGDNVRHGLNRDLGFTEADRVENVRRVAEVARLMVDAGLVVIVAFISPFAAERRMARQLFGEGEFLEVFVDTPLEECERRDPKGLYAKARRGELANFTGVDSAYERPIAPEVRVQTVRLSPAECVETLVERIEAACGSSRGRGR